MGILVSFIVCCMGRLFESRRGETGGGEGGWVMGSKYDKYSTEQSRRIIQSGTSTTE
jgi:hypothetical protein